MLSLSLASPRSSITRRPALTAFLAASRAAFPAAFLAAFLAACNTTPDPTALNTSFEDHCAEAPFGACAWNTAYQVRSDIEIVSHPGGQALQIDSHNGVGFVVQEVRFDVPPEDALLEMTASIKTDSVTGQGAGMNIGVYSADSLLIQNVDMGYGNFSSATGTTGWQSDHALAPVLPTVAHDGARRPQGDGLRCCRPLGSRTTSPDVAAGAATRRAGTEGSCLSSRFPRYPSMSREVAASHFSPDTQDFIRLLHNHDVRYLIVGGKAVIYYGYARLTGDVDFFYRILFFSLVCPQTESTC